MLVVNITTTNNRLDLCASTVFSLINQSVSPDAIIVWVSKEPYMSDDGILSIPDWVGFINSKRDILKFKYTKNTGPYRKIFPALREYTPDDVLVYADDDVVYGKDWLKFLHDMFLKNNGDFVVASRVRIKTKNLFSKYKSYTMFPICHKNSLLDSNFIITGVGGCILSKKHIKHEYFDNEDYINIAPRTDDLWISKIIELSGSRVQVCTEALKQVYEIDHSCGALNQTNNISFGNGLFQRVIRKLLVKMFAYLGFKISNNDISERAINDYFK